MKVTEMEGERKEGEARCRLETNYGWGREGLRVALPKRLK